MFCHPHGRAGLLTLRTWSNLHRDLEHMITPTTGISRAFRLAQTIDIGSGCMYHERVCIVTFYCSPAMNIYLGRQFFELRCHFDTKEGTHNSGGPTIRVDPQSGWTYNSGGPTPQFRWTHNSGGPTIRVDPQSGWTHSSGGPSSRVDPQIR